MLGPLAYPLVPAVLSGALEKAEVGVGVEPPEEAWDGLQSVSPLERRECWRFDRVDRAALWRLSILLQADDQAIPVSNLRDLDRAVKVAEAWSVSVHQEFHVGPDKTVVFLIGLEKPGEGGPEGPRIYGHALHFTQQHKWLGVVWDAALTFAPNLEHRIAAARAAFRPVLALARDGLAPLGEVRELIRTKVKGALFFAPVFLYMADGAVQKLDELEAEVERAIMGASPWVPGPAALRAETGTPLTWGEELILRVVVMRGQLWSLEENLLVKRAWRSSQSFQGHTFARASKTLLDELALPEIWDTPGWSASEEARTEAVQAYKGRIRAELEGRSAMRWRERMAMECPEKPYLSACPAPLSAAAILLAEDDMPAVWAADAWARLRVGITEATERGAKIGERRCPLCRQRSSGLGHLAYQCPQLNTERGWFLEASSAARRTELGKVQEGSWLLSVFSVVADPGDLSANVLFGAAIEEKLCEKQKEAARTRTT